jgi:septum formation protein
MPNDLILASGSATRRQLLENVGLSVTVDPARIDEESLRMAMIAEGASPRDVADGLAEMKARRIAMKHPEGLVLGCDQVLALKSEIFGKAATPDGLKQTLRRLSGQTHMLLSAAVIYEDAEPVWRHVGVVRMHMRVLSDAYLDDYVARNWDEVRHSVGGYHLEAEGLRLFTRVEGDYFNVLGLPMLDILNYLAQRGDIAT